jgi:cytochrome c oxidase subunit II
MTRSPVRRVTGLGCLAAVSAGCMPDAVTEQGADVAWLYTVFMAASAVVFVVVIGLLGWSIVRYRGQPGRDVPMPAAVHGNMALEVVWWALPAALVAVLAVLTIGVLGEVDAREEAPSLVVEVQAYQWGWEFTYADAGVVVNGSAADPPTIELPVGRSVAFVITSQDVVHSFNIPPFLIKRDAIPNRPNRFDVVIDEVGTYSGQCGEFCGLLHARQLFEIDAVTPERFDAWLAERQADAAAR